MCSSSPVSPPGPPSTDADPTMEHKDAYLSDGGSYCPFCKDHDIVGSSIDIMSGSAFQHVHCSNCGAIWCDTYKLVDVNTVHPPKPENER